MTLAINWGMIGGILLFILIVLILLLIVMYVLGRRMQKKQIEQQPLIEANTQTFSMLIIDKKMMRIKDAVEAGLPEQVKTETPVYLRRSKLPVVRAKVGPKVMTLIADPSVYAVLPLKKEVKASVSGLYIRSVKAVRGGTLLTPPKKKKGLMARMAARYQKETEAEIELEKKKQKKTK